MKNLTNILYVSCLISSEYEQQLVEKNSKSLGLQVQKYHRLLSKGFAMNGINVKTCSFNNSLKFLDSISDNNENNVHYHYIKANKPKVVQYLEVIYKSYKYALDYFRLNDDSVMICDVLNISVSIGAALAAKKTNKKVVGIITDFPEYLYGRKSLNTKLIWKMINMCDAYILLTSNMKEQLNPNKNTIVLEGHADLDMEFVNNDLSRKKTPRICLYAGLLDRKYGIETLVKAFIKANINDCVLELYGDGEYVEELKKVEDERVVYYGIVQNNEVVSREIISTLLINPRPSNEEFTKYSFPSKNMEYMVSGTPLLTTKLAGMPSEYYDYIYLFEDESIDGMCQTLKRVMSIDSSILYEKGKAAKEFIISKKSNYSQAQKVIEFILKEVI